MSVLSGTSDKLPDGPVRKGKLSRDDLMMRGGMMVIALYLVITLAFPLYAMLSADGPAAAVFVAVLLLPVCSKAMPLSPRMLNP